MSREGITQELKNIALKISESKGRFYDFFNEENKIALKYLISLLYDEYAHAHIASANFTLGIE